MKQTRLRRWHRRAGVILAPFLLLQAVSGLVLSYGVFTRVASALADETPPIVRSAWNLLMLKAHFGSGLAGWLYHSFIGLGLVWMIGSGAWLWFELWRKRNRGSPEE